MQYMSFHFYSFLGGIVYQLRVRIKSKKTARAEGHVLHLARAIVKAAGGMSPESTCLRLQSVDRDRRFALSNLTERMPWHNLRQTKSRLKRELKSTELKW
jgi:hypothetical protein